MITILVFLSLADLSGVGYWPQGTISSSGSPINAALSYSAFLGQLVCVLYFIPSLPSPFRTFGSTILTTLLSWALVCALFSDTNVMKAVLPTVKLITVAYFFLLVSIRRPKKLEKALLYFTLFFVTSSIFLAVAMPGIGVVQNVATRAGDWRGVLSYKTQTGVLSLILLCVYIFRSKGDVLEQWSLTKAYIVIGLMVIIYGTQSKMTWLTLGFIVLLSILHFILINVRSGYRVPVLMIWFAVFLLFLPVMQDVFLGTLDATGRDLTFSGRIVIWSYFIGIAKAHPFLGYGMASQLRDPNILLGAHVAAGWDNFSSAHSAVIEWFLTGGYISLTLFVVLLISFSVRGVIDAVAGKDLGSMRNLALSLTILVSALMSSDMGNANGTWLAAFLILFYKPQKKYSMRVTGAQEESKFNYA